MYNLYLTSELMAWIYAEYRTWNATYRKIKRTHNIQVKITAQQNQNRITITITSTLWYGYCLCKAFEFVNQCVNRFCRQLITILFHPWIWSGWKVFPSRLYTKNVSNPVLLAQIAQFRKSMSEKRNCYGVIIIFMIDNEQRSIINNNIYWYV